MGPRVGVSAQIQAEARLLLGCALSGIRFLLLFDCLRILRFLFLHPGWLINVEDFFYWLYVSLQTFLLLQEGTGGRPRFLAMTVILLSMLAYNEIISKSMRKRLQKQWDCIRMKLHKWKCRKT